MGKYLDGAFYCSFSDLQENQSANILQLGIIFMTKLSSQETTYATYDNIFVVWKRMFFILLTATLHFKDIFHNLLLLYELLTYAMKNILAGIISVTTITLSKKYFQF